MTFSEANTVRDPVRDVAIAAGMTPVAGMDLPRTTSDVLLSEALRDALIRLNPEIAAVPERADVVVHALRETVLTARSGSLLAANEVFTSWLRGERSMPFGADGEHVTIHLLDLDDPSSSDNHWVVSTEVTFRQGRVSRRFDMVVWCNGIPLVVGEAKTPVRPGYSWEDGAYQVHQDYEKNVPTFFVPNIFAFTTEGKDFRYGAVGTPEHSWGPWRDGDQVVQAPSLAQTLGWAAEVLRPETIVDFLRYFTAFGTDRKHRRIKVIARFQQFQTANAIVDRALDGEVQKGLIWHFQGSGKSLLMVFATLKLRAQATLRSPTVLIVVDRIQLDTQITGDFLASGVPNVVTTESVSHLMELLRSGTRKVIITTIHKFAEADGVIDERDNVVVFVDEAHRSQEGDYGRRMRTALPNAFLFGLSGTPINRRDRNTFAAFGAEEDAGGYLSRYTFAQSIRDGATLPLRFEPRPVELAVNQNGVNLRFDQLVRSHDLDERQKATLSRREATVGRLIKAPGRIRMVAADVVAHYQAHVEPNGFKAQIVAYDKEACVAYKDALDQILPDEATAVVMSMAPGDPAEWQERFSLTTDQEAALLDRFRDPADPLKFLIVTAKLLTGFDAPILQAQYLDKPMRDHTLLQAICRTNRVAPGKQHGLVVDYLGAFDDLAASLRFDDPDMKDVITSLDRLKRELAGAFEAALSHFDAIDRRGEGGEGLIEAQAALPDENSRSEFAADYGVVHRLWEALNPDPDLTPYEYDYVWLTAVYQSVKPASPISRGLWRKLGAKTLEIINDNVSVGVPRDDVESIELTPEVVDDFSRRIGEDDNDRRRRNTKDLEKILAKTIASHRDDPAFVELGKRLAELRERYIEAQQESLEFFRELLELARDIAAAEKRWREMSSEERGRTALTRLFESVRTDKTPVETERVVADIDRVVRDVRWKDWQSTTDGDRRVQQELRRVLWIKHKIRDRDLFEKALQYIREYY
jgi:type I restriction enzyme R subunit